MYDYLTLCCSEPYRREGERRHKIGFRFQVEKFGRTSAVMSSVQDVRPYDVDVFPIRNTGRALRQLNIFNGRTGV